MAITKNQFTALLISAGYSVENRDMVHFRPYGLDKVEYKLVHVSEPTSEKVPLKTVDIHDLYLEAEEINNELSEIKKEYPKEAEAIEEAFAKVKQYFS